MAAAWSRAAAVLVLVTLAGPRAAAHHNMGTVYDLNQRFIRSGTLAKVDWRNPHIFLVLEMKDARGAVESWQFEGPPPRCFRNRDIGRAEFESSVTKTVTIAASPARDGSHAGLFLEITLADGRVASACP
jgi:hypothetical protein